MEETLQDIFKQLETHEYLDERALTKLINKHNKRLLDGAQVEKANTRPLSKRRLIAYFLQVKRNEPEHWAHWGLSPEQERRVIRTLQMKPRRTASGVATITVLTKPWKCSSDCLYCPNDLRMPKSYLADEPACQRAERTCFDPYLQVAARLKALTEMGHVTDKVELIILGGTWSDYPLAYQIWFVRELFRALNEGGRAFSVSSNNGIIDGVRDNFSGDIGSNASDNTSNDLNGDISSIGNDTNSGMNNVADDFSNNDTFTARQQRYAEAGISCDAKTLIQETEPLQKRIDARELSYNQAFDLHYASSPAWNKVASWQQASWEELEAAQHYNETADHRVVGLVIETRPERVTPAHTLTLRRLGCTKVQMGIQSLDESVREQNKRYTTTTQIQHAFETLRLFGFKTHIHAMVNLLGATPESDKQDYQRLVSEAPFQPDEVKLYPCVLVAGTGLCAHYENATWQPYPEDKLIEVLVSDTCATPPYARISRMIRDISAPDIVAGNKKVNLRQMVESYIDQHGLETKEIRHREVSLADIDPSTLTLEVVPYETTATSERFLQWVTPKGMIAGFLRLSLPHNDALESLNKVLAEDGVSSPFASGEAMIREVHVYGRVAKIDHEEHLPSKSSEAQQMTQQHTAHQQTTQQQVAHQRITHHQADQQQTANQETTQQQITDQQAAHRQGAQHQGLGTQLVERACILAREAGYERINVISAIGTRGYYRKLGFYDNGLYQQRNLLK